MPDILHVKKHKLSPHIWAWKLRDPATASQFQSAFKIKMMTSAAVVATTAGANADTTHCVESAWSKLKGPLMDAAYEVCCLSKNNQRKFETWCWNEQVDEATQEKHIRFKVYNVLKKGGMTAEAKVTQTAYIDTKRMAKYAVLLAKFEAAKDE